MTKATDELYRNKLKALIVEKGIVVGSDHFTMSSGYSTTYYYDIKNVMMYGEGMKLITHFARRAARLMKVKSIGGIALGSLPWLGAVIHNLSFHSPVMLLNGFYVRSKTKEHGLKEKIVGLPISPAMILEDVLTTGRSVVESIWSIREAGYNVSYVFAVIDREQGGKQNLEALGVRLFSIFRHSEFADYINQRLNDGKE